MTGAERQRRYRERQAELRRAERERASVRAVLAHAPDPACECCGEPHAAFLALVGGRLWCRNCEPYGSTGRVCPHRGIGRRLG